jgi:hypothetical protein
MRILTVLLALSIVAGSAPAVFADNDKDRDKQDKFEAKLSGYNEVIFSGNTVPPTLRGAVSSTGREHHPSTHPLRPALHPRRDRAVPLREPIVEPTGEPPRRDAALPGDH